MRHKIKSNIRNNRKENGAALVTVLMISVLLGIAIVALLSSVGANSKNSTDVLSETKAYYVAESGLQSTINVLRNTPAATYSAAVANPSLSNWITYNCSGTKVSVGPNSCASAGTSYSINVSDPDNSSALTTFSTIGTFPTNGTGTISFPNSTSPSRITLSFDNVTNCGISFTNNTHCNPNPTTLNPLLSTLRIEKIGTTSIQIPSTGVRFSINYVISDPRPATRTIRGTISQATSSSNILITFDSPNYTLMGTIVNLCQTATINSCAGISFSIPNPATASVTNSSFFMRTTPVEPYRLKVLSTGYGPNGAKKQLEGIIQNNFFNDLGSSAAITMQGTGNGLVFNNGNSSVASLTGDNGVPSVGVMDSTGLTNVLNGIPSNNNHVTPAPAVITDVPDWLASPQNLDAMISQLRITAKNSNRYNADPGNSSPKITNVGDFTTGTGITFCEGNCTANVDGGGILVVTGTLQNKGGWSFKGLIIITGTGGWERSGGGNGLITGNVVIAPYTSAQLASNVFSLPPKYTVTGNGTSEIEYDALNLDTAFDGTSSISNFMLGVAEK